MDIDRFSIRRHSSYSPKNTLADASRCMMLCKLLIGQHPGRVVIIEDFEVPVVEVYWSTSGVAISILHTVYVSGSMMLLMRSNLNEFRQFAIIDLDLSYVQKFIVNLLNILNMYALFIQLFWHRRCVHDRHSLMILLERNFSKIGIDVELQRYRTYIRSVLWAIGFVVFNLFHLSYSVYLFALADPPWMWIVVAIALIMLPTIYRVSMVIFYLYDLAETKRHFIQLNDVLLAVLHAERLKAAKSGFNDFF